MTSQGNRLTGHKVHAICFAARKVECTCTWHFTGDPTLPDDLAHQQMADAFRSHHPLAPVGRTHRRTFSDDTTVTLAG